MKLNLAKNKIAMHIGLALAAGVLTVGCAGNGAKKTQTAEVTPTAPIITVAQTETPTETKVQETVQEEAPIVIAEDATITENSAAPVIEYPDVDTSENTQPEQLSFQFGFDKSELSKEDKEIVMKHARFLVDNPEMVLKIQGHTDHHGPKVYNEYLSKKRSEAVAKILIDQGVQESQLKIIAMANEAPLTDAEDTRLNRRVELEYSEMNLVSNN
jgi:peptidoglycan-associated lipoprotein